MLFRKIFKILHAYSNGHLGAFEHFLWQVLFEFQPVILSPSLNAIILFAHFRLMCA